MLSSASQRGRRNEETPLFPLADKIIPVQTNSWCQWPLSGARALFRATLAMLQKVTRVKRVNFEKQPITSARRFRRGANAAVNSSAIFTFRYALIRHTTTVERAYRFYSRSCVRSKHWLTKVFFLQLIKVVRSWHGVVDSRETFLLKSWINYWRPR